MTLSTEVDNLVFYNQRLQESIAEMYKKLDIYTDFLEAKLEVYEGLEINNEKILKDYSELNALKNSLSTLDSDLDDVKLKKDELLNSVIAIIKYHDNLSEEDIERISKL